MKFGIISLMGILTFLVINPKNTDPPSKIDALYTLDLQIKEKHSRFITEMSEQYPGKFKQCKTCHRKGVEL